MTTYTLEREDTGQELSAYQIRDEAARLDGAATDMQFAALDRLTAENERLRAELAALKAELHPLDRRRDGWTPRPKTMPRKHWTQVHSVADLTEQQRNSALIEPKLDELRDGDSEIHLGAPIAAELMTGVDRKPGWATWLGEIHHADAEWADIVARLRAMPDQYAAPPIERTVVQPVQVDYSYQQSEAWLWAEMVVGQSQQRDSVYAELAPDKITQDSPSDAAGQNREATPPTTPERASGRGSGAETPQSPVNGPDDRQPSPPGAPARPAQDLTPAERAIVDAATQRRKKLAQAAHGERAELPVPEPEGTVRASRWSRLVAWFGGATTRRRQTEQDESEYDDTALPRQVGVAIGLTLGFFLAFMGVAWIVGVL